MTKAKNRSMVKDYWPRYYKRALFLTIVMQVLVTGVTAGALVISGAIIMSLYFWITLVAVFTSSLGFNILLINQIVLPLKNLTSALTHISGEPSLVTPPNPNARHYEKEGFKPLLQLIYTLSGTEKTSEVQTSQKAKIDFTRALNNSTLGLVFMDKSHTIVFSNKSAPVRSDQNNVASIDLDFEDHLTLDAWLKKCEESKVSAEHSWQRVSTKNTDDGERKIYDIAASYQKGNDIEVVLSFFDQTNLYHPEDEGLDFIAFAAHELRGPITVIRGYLDVLDEELEDTIDPDQLELLKRLIVSANRLSSYVNNILNASRYDRRHLKIHLKEGSLTSVYDSIKDDMSLRAQAQNRLLIVTIPDSLPTIAVDKGSLSEVIGNLIDNAIKYSNEGGTVSVTSAVDGDYVKVSVEDQGIGMPSSVVSNLFHKFYRSHRSRETVAGTGIGLYICKAIVESHGGKISVRSVEGVGSTFEFTVPIYATVAKKLAASNNSNEGLIAHNEGWIKNHSMYRG